MWMHNAQHPYLRDVCDKFSSKLSSQYLHLLKTPWEVFLLWCNKLFHAQSYLNTCQHIHSREYPYSCNVCNKSFSSSEYFLVPYCELTVAKTPYYFSPVVLSSVYLFIHFVTHVTLDTSITVYNLYITTQVIIHGHPPNVINNNTRFKDQLDVEFNTTSRYIVIDIQLGIR